MTNSSDISLVFETSGRAAHVGLGRDDAFQEAREVPRTRRNNLELIPTADALLLDHGLSPNDLTELYVSVGPGSFTGLRMAIAAAKMLAMTNAGLKLVAVPTLDVLAEQNSQADRPVAVCLNIKRGTMYCAVYQGGEQIIGPALRTLDELMAAVDEPAQLALVSEVDLEHSAQLSLDQAVADPCSTWAVGQSMAQQQRFTAPQDLLPLYIREPEAVTLWNELGRD
ncbi:MAG: tRNA (adenosine(37)-N6)-threonylcarbamoyltransferase complex dimerization subunit type 1 TsaB [Phycisphaeraceae bacterium]|nr:tRNA (adenosine(37)-N6)-threonylcarbamoyltransferase complex dimerization subunit type 1 TsaB [Phycisphaeraceae bacterium]